MISDMVSGFIQEIERADVENNSHFMEIMNKASVILGISERDLAHKFQVSPSTIVRWKTGVNEPYPGVRKFVFKYLLMEASKLQAEKLKTSQ